MASQIGQTFEIISAKTVGCKQSVKKIWSSRVNPDIGSFVEIPSSGAKRFPLVLFTASNSGCCKIHMESLSLV